MINEIEQMISIDPYFISLVKYANKKRLRGDSVRTGRILTEGKLGNWTLMPNVFLECLPHALRNTSSAAAFKIILYLVREILGRTRTSDGRPLFYKRINKLSYFVNKCCINGYGSFYRAKEILENKRIIYFSDDKVYLNTFPLTWNIEDEDDRNNIKCIVEKEIEKVNSKTEENDE
jgi:hypothetical protein